MLLIDHLKTKNGFTIKSYKFIIDKNTYHPFKIDTFAFLILKFYEKLIYPIYFRTTDSFMPKQKGLKKRANVYGHLDG